METILNFFNSGTIIPTIIAIVILFFLIKMFWKAIKLIFKVGIALLVIGLIIWIWQTMGNYF